MEWPGLILMNKKNLLYLCDGIGSVFESQVIELLAEVSKRNIFDRVILLLGIPDSSQIKLAASLTDSSFETIFFKSFPNFPFYNLIYRVHLRKALTNANLDMEDTLFHARGEVMSWQLSMTINKKYRKFIFPDIRGASIEEIIEYSGFCKIVKWLKVINYKRALLNLKNLNIVTCVSVSCKKYLLTRFHIREENILVIPCLAGKNFKLNLEERVKIREELKIDYSDILVVFSTGGCANWQNYSQIEAIADKGLKVLNLSKTQIHHMNILNKFIKYAEMPLYLSAADVAFIWRDKSIVNQVASPVKFSEYICCGLPVIANDTIEMVNEYISLHSCGLIINNINDLDPEIVEKLICKNRQQISDGGRKIFGLSSIVDSYIEAYKCL